LCGRMTLIAHGEPLQSRLKNMVTNLVNTGAIPCEKGPARGRVQHYRVLLFIDRHDLPQDPGANQWSGELARPIHAVASRAHLDFMDERIRCRTVHRYPIPHLERRDGVKRQLKSWSRVILLQ